MRREVWMVVGALALLASVVTGREKPAVDIVIERKPSAAREDIDLSRLQRPAAEAPAADPFARRSFGPADKAAPRESPSPSAPALPFRYFGKVIEDGKLEIFVMHGDETLGVKAGAKVGDYRVDKVSEQSITFTYLPLNTRQTLDIPAVHQ
jgi:hypothetical protein